MRAEAGCQPTTNSSAIGDSNSYANSEPDAFSNSNGNTYTHADSAADCDPDTRSDSDSNSGAETEPDAYNEEKLSINSSRLFQFRRRRHLRFCFGGMTRPRLFRDTRELRTRSSHNINSDRPNFVEMSAKRPAAIVDECVICGRRIVTKKQPRRFCDARSSPLG